MAEVKFILKVIETMAKGAVADRVECPICRGEKHPEKWICNTCFRDYGSGMVEEVQRAVRRVANKVPPEVWQNLLKVARNLLSAPDRPEGVEDRDLVNALKPRFNGVLEGTIFAALDTAHRIMEVEAKEAAREVEREARWQTALSAVREQFPNGNKIQIHYFIKNPIPFESTFISERMMRAARAEVINERVQARKSQMAAAFVGDILEKIDFSKVKQTELVAVPS